MYQFNFWEYAVNMFKVFNFGKITVAIFAVSEDGNCNVFQDTENMPLVTLNGMTFTVNTMKIGKFLSSTAATVTTQDTTYTSLQGSTCFQKSVYQETKIGMIQIYSILLRPLLFLLMILE
jgi:hypothetical protein